MRMLLAPLALVFIAGSSAPAYGFGYDVDPSCTEADVRP